MINGAIIEEINNDSNGEEIEVSDVETREVEEEKTEEGAETDGAMRLLKVTLEDIDLDGLNELEAIDKHLQVIYDNQRSILNKLSEIKKEHDYNVKWLTDEVNFLVKEHGKMTHNIV